MHPVSSADLVVVSRLNGVLTLRPEQKRRKAIRDAYELLTEIVPGTAGMSRSEGMVLRATLDHIKSELERRKSLIEKLEERGERVGDEDKT